jgi:hypothetical protein
MPKIGWSETLTTENEVLVMKILIDKANSGSSWRVGLLLAALVLGAATGARAQASIGVLGNPADGGTYSGIGLISGFHCGANDLKVVIDEGTSDERVLVPAYGTERKDTLATCGQENTGFGLLWNYALFSSGSHTARGYANGSPFGALSTFNVVRLDEDKAFVRDLSGNLSIAEFPVAGESTQLIWQQGQQGFLINGFDGLLGTPDEVPSAPRETTTAGSFEVPGNTSFQSGISVMSGWACEAESVTIEIDGGAQVVATAYGTERADTEEICGHSATGFGVLWNYNLLGPGQHVAVAKVDGVVLGSSTFWVTEIDGDNDEGNDRDFLRDLSGTFPIDGFPSAEQTTDVSWSTATQNFVVSDVRSSDTPGPTPTPAVEPTPTPAETPGPTSAPTPTPAETPAPTPPAGFCGDGIVDYELGEECDTAGTQCTPGPAGDDCRFEKFDYYLDCEEAFGGWDDNSDFPCTGELLCGNDCKIDGTACSCNCEEDFDCLLPDDHEIQCGSTYCTPEVCSEDDLDGCDCEIYEACQRGSCVTTPVDPASVEDLCFGTDPGDPTFKRCDWCEVF